MCCFSAVPAILNEAVPATTQNVDVEIQQTMIQAHRYTALVERILGGEIQEGPPLQMIKDALINARQHEAFLRIILVGDRKYITAVLPSRSTCSECSDIP